MAIKMICSDIDGTLLQYGRKKLEGEIFDQIRALHDRSILFCPASGRQYTSLRLLFEPVADCCVFLCENGGVLFKDEQCIAENPMPRALAEEIAHDLWERSDGQGEVMLSGQNCAYLMERGLGMLDRIRFIGNRYKVIADPSEIPEEIVKVSVYLHEGVAPYVDRFVPRWQQANCAVAGPYWIDTTTANKGVGVESLCRVPVEIDVASEFRYRRLLLPPNALVVIISQSGETADSLAALREAKKRGAKTLALVNVVGSSIARESDHVFYTLAGPEIAVATTKAYSTQLAAAYLLSLAFAQARNTLPPEELARYFRELEALPGKILRILEDQARIQWFAAKHAAARDIFFIGRGLDYAICMEGSLKTKEISYIHSEAYAAGELKHGTISLIEPGTLVVGVLA